jgi:hypothetical protein
MATISFVISVCLSVRTEQRRSPTVPTAVKKFYIPGLFSKNCRDFYCGVPVGFQVDKKSPFVLDLKCALLCSWQPATCPLPRATSVHINNSNPIFLVYFNIILPTTTVSSKLLFPYGFPTKTQYAFPFYTTHPTLPAHPIIRDFIIRIIGHYKPKSHTLYNSSYTQQNSDYRFWSHSLWTAGGIRSYCLLKKIQLSTYCHHNPLRSDIALGRSRRLRKILSAP